MSAEPFDTSRLTDMLKGIDGNVLQPIIKRAADDFYEAVLENAHDYLRDNLDENLKTEIHYLRHESAEMRRQLFELRGLVGNPYGPHDTSVKAIGDMLATNARLVGSYDELIYAVSKKHEGETRHETALRYIKNAEKGSGDQNAAKATLATTDGREG